jgi:membrane-bound serine protease (ClpP class)
MSKYRLLLITLALWLFWVVGHARAQGNEVLVLSIQGPVTPTMVSYFDRGIRAGEQQNAEAVLVVLNTPGGAVTTMHEVVQLFLAADVPVIVYVSPAGAHAASAGSLITMAAHAAAMAPDTVIGAASPVAGGGEDIPETAFRKATEDLMALARSLTERRGEEAVVLAEAMILEARAVHAREALAVGLIDVVARDVPDLLHQLDGLTVEVNRQPVTLQTAGARQVSVPMTGVERMLHALSNPLLISILMVIGVQAILIEISNPGGWIPGIIGVLCLAMALYGLGTLPTNWLGLGLVAIAFALFIAEALSPAFGGLALAGGAALLAGLLVLFNSPGTPEFARISVPAAVGISVVTAAFFIFLVTMALRSHKTQPVTGREAMLGQVGVARSEFEIARPGSDEFSGDVLVMGELWRALADEQIGAGERIVVKGVNGFTLRVKRG